MTAATSGDGVAELDPRAAQQLIDASADQAIRQVYPQPSLQFAVWAVAWLVAMIAAYLGIRADGPLSFAAGMTIYAVALGAGVLFEIVYLSRRMAGVGGATRAASGIWGISWAVAFLSAFLVSTGLVQLADSPALADTVPFLMPTLAVGAVYMQGGALFPPSRMTLVGWLLLLVAGVAALFGPVNHLLILGIGGAASFGVGALVTRRGNQTAIASER